MLPIINKQPTPTTPTLTLTQAHTHHQLLQQWQDHHQQAHPRSGLQYPIHRHITNG